MEDLDLVQFLRGSRATDTHTENSDWDTTTIYLGDTYKKISTLNKFVYTKTTDDNHIQVELEHVIKRLIMCDSSYLEFLFKDNVMDKSNVLVPYYFQLIEELKESDLLNKDLIISRGVKHFTKEADRILKVANYNNTDKMQNILFQNIRIEMLVDSILEGRPLVKPSEKQIVKLKDLKYADMSSDELIEKTLEFKSRWENRPKVAQDLKRDSKLDNIYMEFVRMMDKMLDR